MFAHLPRSITQRFLGAIAVEQSGWVGPRANSLAAREDTVWPHTPLSDVVRTSVLTAHESANHALALLEADVPPAQVAFYTMARCTLVGASQALWLVNAGEPQLRQARTLTVLRHDHSQRMKFHKSQARSTDPDRAAHAAHIIEFWGARIREIDRALVGLPPVPRQPTTTEMISWAAENEFTAESDAVSTFLATWQISSGYAHALPWPNFVLPGATLIHPDGKGPTPFRIGFHHERAWEELATCVSVLGLSNRAALTHAGYCVE
ncbi:hypothetical protein [Serinibacter salmoneus]|uniref:hypothetical protein n=1 Tax=Serinibacter salmoneus TaxID=556530 RepID=UPI000BF3B4F0|nr:hypothetical protein [Serinibacter salmoneus]